MKVELIDSMGDDLAVVNAARVSFDKESKWVYDPDWQDKNTPEFVLSEKASKLIHYLVKHHHWSPFSHCVAKFRVRAPLFVARQLAKHQVGGSWNEVSRRYVDSEPSFYTPEKWRKRAEDKKQGSSDEEVVLTDVIIDYEQGWYKDLSDLFDCVQMDQQRLYKELLKASVAPEQARMVLPQSMFTEWIWTGSLAFFARVYVLRTHENAQEECRWVAEEIGKHMEKLYPVSWKELTNGQGS